MSDINHQDTAVSQWEHQCGYRQVFKWDFPVSTRSEPTLVPLDS
jgi:hypothetical protein